MQANKVLPKFLALISVVRGYNIVVLVLAMYLASIFIFSTTPEKQTLLDARLFFIILASALSAAAGYIINNYYDLEKDLLQRPLQVYVNRFVSNGFKLKVYLVFNFISLLLAVLVSFRVFIFFGLYILATWFYSHKVNRWLVINNLWAVVLRILPFFALLIYFNNFEWVILAHALFLIGLLLQIEWTKDLVSYKADLSMNYNTLPTRFGLKACCVTIQLSSVLLIVLAFVMANCLPVGYMRWYFYGAIVCFICLILFLMHPKKRTLYKLLVVFLKLLVLIGVCCIVFIEINPLNLQNYLSFSAP